MASNQAFVVEATVRHDQGKGASRRLRRNEKIPGVVYGGKKEAVSLSLEHKDIAKQLRSEAFYSHILTLKTDKETDMVVLKDVQRHPYKPRIMHVDFLRVSKDEKLVMHVPLHFIGEDKALGVKEGGVVSHNMSDVEISCLPANLPEYLEVNVTDLKMNETIHLSDIKLPEGVEIVALTHEDDKSVVSIHMPRAEEEPETEEAPEAGEVPASEQKAEGEGEEKAEDKKEDK